MYLALKMVNLCNGTLTPLHSMTIIGMALALLHQVETCRHKYPYVEISCK